MKSIFFCFLTVVSLTFYYCSEDSPIDQSPTGKLLIKSNPSGALINLGGINTGETTPYTLENLEQGSYSGFLYLQYYDTTYFTASVFNNTTTTIDTTLEDGLPFVEFSFDFQLASGDDSVRFYFTINQDVTMDSIRVVRPLNTTGTYVTDKYLYNAEMFESRDQTGNLIKYYLPPPGSGSQYYLTILNRDYNFGLFGHKAYGAKPKFLSYYQVGI